MDFPRNQKELARYNSWEYKVEEAERNKFLNMAWDELIEMFPESAHLHPHLSERPSCVILSYG